MNPLPRRASRKGRAGRKGGGIISQRTRPQPSPGAGLATAAGKPFAPGAAFA
jgi:hypothetical protein